MATTIHRTRAKDGARQAKLERLLSQQESSLHSHRQSLREGLPTVMSGVLDLEEHSVDAEEQSVGLSVLALRSQSIQGIEAALQRLAAGDFGKCSECRGEISGGRLKAQPFATLCLACQEKHDSAAVSRRPGSSRPERRWAQ